MKKNLVFLCLVMLHMAYAAVPSKMNFQGKLTDATGVGIVGTRSITVRIYSALTGGTALWTENHPSVSVTKGLFDIVLGTYTPIVLPFDVPYYVELQVGSDVMSPRVPLNSVSYAFRTALADSVLYHTHCAQHWTCGDSGLWVGAVRGYALRGTTSDTARAGVFGEGGTRSAGVWGKSSAVDFPAVYGVGTNTIGVVGECTGFFNAGVFGAAPTDTIGFGVYGAGGLNDAAVFGIAGNYGGSFYTGTGVVGLSKSIGGYFCGDTTNTSWGLFAETFDERGIAIRARSNTHAALGYNYAVHASCSTGTRENASDSIITFGCAVFAQNFNDSGSAVVAVGNGLGDITIMDRGSGLAANGRRIAVFAHADTNRGSFAVLARSTSTSGVGVLGEENDLEAPSTPSFGAGVLGYSNNAGVYGWADTTSNSVGVLGISNSQDDGTGVFGISRVGVYAEGKSSNTAVFGIYAWANDTIAVNVVDIAVYGGCEDVAEDYAGVFDGDVDVGNDFRVWGAKSAAVITPQGGKLLYSQESPEVWFEDFGDGKLKDGKTEIKLPTDFLATVTIDEAHPMKVFVQLTDTSCNGVAVIKGKTGFTVVELAGGRSNATFDWRIVAKRKGYENTRLESCERPQIIPPTPAAANDAHVPSNAKTRTLKNTSDTKDLSPATTAVPLPNN